MPKQIISLSNVVKLISQKHGMSSGDVYAQLRDAVSSGIIEAEGVEVFEQDTNMGKHGKTHHFSDCERVVEIWEGLFLTGDAKADMLLVEVRDAIDGNIKLKAQFPNWLLRKILKYIADK